MISSRLNDTQGFKENSWRSEEFFNPITELFARDKHQ